MNSNSDRLIELFGLALEKKSPAERARFLAGVCQGDAPLRQQLEALLRSHEEAGPFLKSTPLAVDPDLPSEKPGDFIGRYKLLQKIGEGGCGVVYMAEQEKPVRRRVALKVIKLGMDTRGVIARFEAERQALALMDHPNIAKIHDAGATETGRPYFVMELVRGIRITHYCDQINLSTAARLALFTQVCEAIQHAHQKSVIHRDIKPSNILVTVNDGVAMPKVIDFGIAKATEQKLTDKTLFTAFDQFIGTPAYMSPEQAVLTSVDIDTRSDIYSLGVLLYELLTGRTPFDTKALQRAGLDEIRRTIRETEPLRPSTRLSTMQNAELTAVASDRQSDPARLPTLIRGDLDWIVMKAIEKDRARRYETANSLTADIQRFLTNEPIVARPPSPFYRLQKFARRNTVAFATAAIVLTVLVLGGAVSTWQAVRATRAVREQDRLLQVANTATGHEAAQRERAEQNLYASDMRQAFQCLEKDELGRALGLLNRHRPTASAPTDRRGFEWRYLWKLCQGDSHDFLESGEGRVWWLEYSPGGRFLAAGRDREVTIFNLASKSIIAHLDENTGSESRWGIPRWAVFTPDGKTLITARHDRVTLYETTNWTELPLQFPPAGGPIALSPDGNSLVTMPFTDSFETRKSFDKVVTIRDLRTLRVLRTLTNVDSPTIFSPDGKRLATDTPEGIKLWPLDPSAGPAMLLEGSSNLLSHYSGYDSLRKTVAFSPDGRRIASGSSSANLIIRLWDAATGQRIDRDQFHGHHEAITGVAFSPDSRFVASAGFDSTIRIWDIANLKLHRKLRGQLGAIWALAFAPDGGSLVSGGENGRDDPIKVWPFDGASQPEERDLIDRWHPVWVSTNGEEVITFDVTGAEQWNTRTGQRRSVLSRPDALAAIAGPDGGSVYAGTSNGVVYFGDFATGEIIARSGGHSAGVVALVASPDGGMLVTGGRDAGLCWWELPSARLIRSNKLSGAVTALEFSPDGKILVSTSEDLKLSWWDTASGRLFDSCPTPKPIFRLAFSPNGKLLAAIGESRTWLWEIATRTRRRHTVIGRLPWNFSPDSTKFLTPAQLWDASDGQLLGRLEGHKTGVEDSVFSPDGRTIATSSADVRLWDNATQQELLILAKPGMGSANLMFSADGSTLVAGSSAPGGGGLRIWRAPSFEEIEAKEKVNLHNH